MISGNINSTYFSVYTYGGEMVIHTPSTFYVTWVPSVVSGTIWLNSQSSLNISDYSGSFSVGAISYSSPSVVFQSCGFTYIETNLTETYRISLYSGQIFLGEFGIFEMCESLKYATLPDCRSLGSHAFLLCHSLSSVSLPACTYIGNAAFEECTSLESISLPLCSSLGENAFLYCTSLKSISLPVCQKVHVGAFKKCSSLQSIDLPNCIEIGTSHNITDRTVFLGCISLKSVNLPRCSSVYCGVFYGCSALQTISLPNCVSLGGDAFSSNCPGVFENCTSLQSIDLPVVEFIGYRAFRGCSSLKTVIIRTSNCGIDYPASEVFAGTKISTSQGGIYVPSSYVSFYKSEWSYWSRYIYPIPE
jgi:hypothetical protein